MEDGGREIVRAPFVVSPSTPLRTGSSNHEGAVHPSTGLS